MSSKISSSLLYFISAILILATTTLLTVSAANEPACNASMEASGGHCRLVKNKVDYDVELQLDSDIHRRFLQQQEVYLDNAALDKDRAACLSANPGDRYTDNKCYRIVNPDYVPQSCYEHYYRSCDQ